MKRARNIIPLILIVLLLSGCSSNKLSVISAVRRKCAPMRWPCMKKVIPPPQLIR